MVRHRNIADHERVSSVHYLAVGFAGVDGGTGVAGGGVCGAGPSSTFGAGDSALSPDCADASAIGCVGSASLAW